MQLFDKAKTWMTPERAIAMQGIGMGLSQLAAGQTPNLSPAYSALMERQQTAQMRQTLEQSGVMERFSPDQRAILAQMEPSAAQAIIAQTLFREPPAGPKPTDDMREFQMAQAQGFQGTFQEWLDRNQRPPQNKAVTLVAPGDPSRATFNLPDDGNTYEVEYDRDTMQVLDYSLPGGRGTSVTVNNAPEGMQLPDPPKDMIWATDQNGQVVYDEVDVGGGRTVRRPVAVPLRGTGADQTNRDVEAQQVNAIENAGLMLNTIEGILSDPALDNATGVLSLSQMVPGTPMYRFGTRVQQLQGQVFLRAYESLKGSGQITEVEGRKAEQALSRIQSGLSPRDFREAAEELREVVEAAYERALQTADQPARDLTDEDLMEKYR